MPNYEVMIAPLITGDGDKDVGDIISLTEPQAKPLLEIGAIKESSKKPTKDITKEALPP